MAKKVADSALRRAVVLVGVSIDGVLYEAGDLILIEEAKAKAYAELGSFDFDPGAIAHCEETLGLTARVHRSAESE